jgi:hypothetical protein
VGQERDVNKGVEAVLSPDFIRHEPELGDRTTGSEDISNRESLPERAI